MNGTFILKLIDDGNPLGSMWHAIDINTNKVLSKSFGKWIAKKNAELMGYIYDLNYEKTNIKSGND
jgi:hypothetical protein